jgi:hypothetical protein
MRLWLSSQAGKVPDANICSRVSYLQSLLVHFVSFSTHKTFYKEALISLSVPSLHVICQALPSGLRPGPWVPMQTMMLPFNGTTYLLPTYQDMNYKSGLQFTDTQANNFWAKWEELWELHYKVREVSVLKFRQGNG